MLSILPNNEAEWQPFSLKQYGLLGHSQQEALRNKPSKDSNEQLSQQKFPKTGREGNQGDFLVWLLYVLFGLVWFGFLVKSQYQPFPREELK